MLAGSLTRKEKARKLITQVMNSLTAKSEIGSPMACLYLLGNPDHYTSHKFVPFYWKSYVNYILNQEKQLANNEKGENFDLPDETVIIQKNVHKQLVAYNPVFDYVY